jgi:superfamily II DNA helicase RecQ
LAEPRVGDLNLEIIGHSVPSRISINIEFLLSCSTKMTAAVDVDETFDEEQIRQACIERYGYPPKPFQIAAARSLHQRKDKLVIAPTGSGKSLIMQLPFLFKTASPEDMALCVSPLKALQKEQAAKDASFVYVNADNNTPELRGKIAAKEYRMILVGPKMLQEKSFRKLLKNAEWSRNLRVIYVDECHVVDFWGTAFRPLYRSLSEIRHLDADRIPLTAMSATVPMKTYNRIEGDLELRDPTIINVGSARDNIHYSFRKFQHFMAGFQDVWNILTSLHSFKAGGKLESAPSR